MSKEPPGHSSETAYQLETPQQHRDFYDDWAETYDSGFAQSKGYEYPKRIAEYFVTQVSQDQGPVMDIGCGTGLVGESLRQNGWSSWLDGVDISEGMLEVARAKGVYGRLFKEDLTKSDNLPKSFYGGLISAGTFTHGHLGPEVLLSVFALARAEAHAVIGINAQHFGNQNFEQAFWEWENNKIISQPKWTETEIYQASDGSETEKKMAMIADFRILVET
jgi:SAM-dependent methyltransferase